MKKKAAPVIKVETETAAQTPPITKKNDYTGDPLWNARRRRLDVALCLSFGSVFYAMYQGPEMATAIAPPAFLTIGGVLGFYFGVAEWGRINGVLGTTTTTETSVKA